MRPMPDDDSPVAPHDHAWVKTGEYYATYPPKWVYGCAACRGIGVARDGEPVLFVEHVDEAEWAELHKYTHRTA